MTIINTEKRKVYVRRLSMLLASAPLREWSLLGSRPTSRAHDGPLRQGDPTGRTKLTTHLAPITIASPSRPLPQHPSTDRGSIYSPRIQSNGAKVTCNPPTRNQSCTDVMNQRLTSGPGALDLNHNRITECLVYLVAHFNPNTAYQAGSQYIPLPPPNGLRSTYTTSGTIHFKSKTNSP